MLTLSHKFKIIRTRKVWRMVEYAVAQKYLLVILENRNASRTGKWSTYCLIKYLFFRIWLGNHQKNNFFEMEKRVSF